MNTATLSKTLSEATFGAVLRARAALVLALLAGVIVCVAGCGTRDVGGGAKEPGDTTSATASGKSKPSGAVATLHMALEFAVQESDPPQTQIDLVETNETGSSTRHNLGLFDGECKDMTAEVRREENVFLAFHCQPFGNQRGVLVHILNRRGRLILLRAWLGTHKPTFDEFDQIGELPPYQGGASLSTDFDPAPQP